MKFIVPEGCEYGRTYVFTLELTRRNLTTLLAKLDDPNSARTLVDPDNRVMVKSVEDDEHYANRPPGPCLTNGETH